MLERRVGVESGGMERGVGYFSKKTTAFSTGGSVP